MPETNTLAYFPPPGEEILSTDARLGEKLFMMGPHPCALDCSAFGFLSVLFYNYPEDHYFRVEAEKRFPNLKMFAERVTTL